MIEYLVGRQGQGRGAQVHAMYLSDQKGWSQDPPLPSPHLRVGSGGGSVSLAVSVHLRPCEGKQLLSLVSVPIAVVFVQVLTCCSRGFLGRQLGTHCPLQVTSESSFYKPLFVYLLINRKSPCFGVCL